MKIYTKRGDHGQTDLFGGGRVAKNNCRVVAYGHIDAANTALGLAYSAPGLNPELKEELLKLMKLLFCAGAEIATVPKAQAEELLDKYLKNRINNNHIQELENLIDSYEEKLSPLKSFILPCGSDGAARLHWARVLVRQAEVVLVNLMSEGQLVRPEILAFFNRLSDLLFVLARSANAKAQVEDVPWSGQL
jgi:cob(I)alamin adenosyltransferase